MSSSRIRKTGTLSITGYSAEIELGIFKDDTRQMLIAIIEKMVQNQHIDSMILGCTEFPLILKESSYAGIPMLNTTKIHVDAIVKYCLG